METLKIQPNYKRSVILAKVQEWLDKKIALKIFKIVNSNDGLTCVDDNRDQLKIIFPDIHLSLNNEAIVFGLILDKNSGWNICGFKLNKNNPQKSILCNLISEVGFEYPNNLATELYRAFKLSGDVDSPSQMSKLIKVLMMITGPMGANG